MTPPSQIAHYKITAKLGEGGMGAVYRATDTKLNRDVAIKLLPDSFAQDPDRLARFDREAQMLAALNHPNIAAIYGLEGAAIVMELVEGEDLHGPLPLDTAISYAQQIAQALEAAHEKNIIHRDLKPANIKVTPDGTIKLLDFGLAKAAEPASAPNASFSPTLTLRATQAGVILGTAAYMSPEQARGKLVDKRADIWAFGVVLYEMLTGKALFAAGDNITDILAAVVTREPDWSALPASTPPHIRRLIERCLQKDSKLRLRDIGEARIALAEPAPAEPAPAATAARRTWLPWLAAAVFALAFATSIGLRHPAGEAPNLRLSIIPPPKTTFWQFALSPDGRRLAFTTAATETEAYDLWVRDLDAGSSRRLAAASVFGSPFWSPDSRFIAFFHDGKLRKIDPTGGQPTVICDARNPRGGAWGSRDVIVFAPTVNGPLYRVPASGGTPTAVTQVDAPVEGSHRWPTFLPDGRRFVYLSRGSAQDRSSLLLGDIESKERRLAAPGISSSAYDPRGFLLFFQDAALRALPWDAGSAQATGDAVPVSEEVEFQINNSMARFSLSANGMLAWIAGGSTGNMQLTWYDREGKVTGTVGPPGQMFAGTVSPDGKSVVTDRFNPQGSGQDLWLYDLARGTESRFTFTNARTQYPVWSPDGRYVAFFGNINSKFTISVKPAAGNSAEQIILESSSLILPADWSRDGRSLIIGDYSPTTHADISVLTDPLDPARRRATPWLQTAANEVWPALSPDGKWMAYSSDESGSFQVYVSSFPGKEAKFQVTSAGGLHPFWSAGGKELFYISLERILMWSQVSTGARFEFSNPKPLFQTRVTTASVAGISPDGKRFLMPAILNPTTDTPIHVVTNWRAGVKP